MHCLELLSTTTLRCLCAFSSAVVLQTSCQKEYVDSGEYSQSFIVIADDRGLQLLPISYPEYDSWYEGYIGLDGDGDIWRFDGTSDQLFENVDGEFVLRSTAPFNLSRPSLFFADGEPVVVAYEDVVGASLTWFQPPFSVGEVVPGVFCDDSDQCWFRAAGRLQSRWVAQAGLLHSFDGTTWTTIEIGTGGVVWVTVHESGGHVTVAVGPGGDGTGQGDIIALIEDGVPSTVALGYDEVAAYGMYDGTGNLWLVGHTLDWVGILGGCRAATDAEAFYASTEGLVGLRLGDGVRVDAIRYDSDCAAEETVLYDLGVDAVYLNELYHDSGQQAVILAHFQGQDW